MGCIQSYFKRAHNAGLSPSSTQDSNNSKTGAQDGGSTVEKDKLSTDCASTGKLSADFTSTGDRAPEEPQSNDTSYGVEATAVRTLAASTGTVAILGTTAKTPQSRRESRVSNIEQVNDEGNNRVAETNADSIDVEIKDDKPDTKKEVPSSVVKEVTEIKPSSLVDKLEEVASAVDKIESVVHKGKTTVNKVETIVSSSTRTESSVTTKEEKVVVVDVETTKVVEDVPTKEVNVVEKDSTKQTTTALVEDVKLDADSSSVAESPLEDAGFSENNFASEGEENEDDRPTTVLEIEKAQSGAEMRSSLSENSENEDTKGIDDEISSEQLKTNSLSDTTLSESYNAGLDSVKQSDNEGATPVVENAEVKVEDEGEPTDKNGVAENDLKRNGKPEIEGKPVVEEVAVLKREVSRTESETPDTKKEVEEEPIIKTVATKVESAPSNRNSGVDQVLSTVDLKEVANKVENGLMNGVAENGEVDSNGVIDDKMSAAATTIQATFRGYQTRQQNKDKVNENLEPDSLPQDITSNDVEVKVMQITEIVDEETEKKLESIIASKEGLIEKVDDKLDAAATAIQATFRGYQTRQNIKKTDEKEGEEVMDKTIKVDGEESKKVEEVSNKVVGEDLVVETKSDGVSQEKVEPVDETKPNSHKVEELVEDTVANKIEESVETKSSREEKLIDKTEANKLGESVDNTKFSKEEKSIDKTETNKVEESVEETKSDKEEKSIDKTETSKVEEYVDKTKSSKEEISVDEAETNKVEESVDKTESSKEDKSVDKTETNEKGKSVGNTIPDEAICNKVEGTKPEVASNIQEVKPVAQNQSVIEAQVDKVPESEEPAKSVSPKVETVLKASQESSDGSSFDSVQNGSLDPVTCVRIQDKKSGVLEKDGSTEKVGVEVKGVENSSIKDEENKESLAATTIQANFRGYQARQNLQKKEEVIKSEEVGEEEDDKVLTAATKIQAGFRGYQTRKKLKEDEDDTVVIEALTSRTPELVESVREEVDEICKRAVETTENLISQGLHKFHKSRSVEEEEVGGGGDEGQENGGIVDESEVVDVAKQTIEAVLEKAEKIADEKLNSAATTIQASFRGFQARQNLEKNTDVDGLPDFPPSTEDEDYTPVPDDDDLPLPDLEALESSYSDELATEPLMPPPPLAATNPPTTPLQNLTIPETEEVSEASTEVGTIEEDLKSLQRPQECDELDRLERERDSTDGESSLSSAATKIQAGVRGYLTRKHINPNQAGTTSTSGPSAALSSDRSLGDFSLSRDEEDGPVRSMISTEEETEIGRHGASSPPQAKRGAMKKRMSLDSRIAGGQAPANFSRTSRAMSVSAVREDANNDEVWQILQTELSSAATLIQSNFRGYQARKQLRRGDAVQMPTTSCSSTPGSNSQDSSRIGGLITERSSGEYHDMIALTPPNIPNIGEEEEEEEEEEGKKTASTTEKSRSSVSRDEDRMVKRRQDEGAQKEEATEEEEAAAKIQAGFRGYKVRRNMNAQDVAATSASPKSCATSNSDAASNNNHSSAEIEAATKIQAGFRGFKTRQELKSSTKTATATDSK
ncbi:A-kinase anchor protein 12 [Nilaparvata lugens]|uniref:A-kinase anchor protein 12 n=1 Tax=Nilaparvata lugens TaxID=108931 RepID=UPI00193EAD19|nr:A-kinase anchor protein 12 [Nilaparvata lugens]XP_039282547.1 A-kinase anchor protein 12 [Nilaparvata lugens]XP_039282548.1 A-kinase anchor protein 12 [Nilaparvata lugens]